MDKTNLCAFSVLKLGLYTDVPSVVSCDSYLLQLDKRCRLSELPIEPCSARMTPVYNMKRRQVRWSALSEYRERHDKWWLPYKLHETKCAQNKKPITPNKCATQLILGWFCMLHDCRLNLKLNIINFTLSECFLRWNLLYFEGCRRIWGSFFFRWYRNTIESVEMTRHQTTNAALCGKEHIINRPTFSPPRRLKPKHNAFTHSNKWE